MDVRENASNEKRLIDADALLETSDVFIVHTKEYGSIEVISVDAVGDAPTVDAVEVVRCNDCQHSKLPAVLTQKYGEPGTLTCHNWHSPCNKRNVNQDDFCSYGERKEGAD